MCFQSQFPHKSVNLVRIPNRNTFSSAEIIERRIDLCPEASSRGLFPSLNNAAQRALRTWTLLAEPVRCRGVGGSGHGTNRTALRQRSLEGPAVHLELAPDSTYRDSPVGLTD
jgi:hypothetical protein